MKWTIVGSELKMLLVVEMPKCSSISGALPISKCAKSRSAVSEKTGVTAMDLFFQARP
jgi:hypothetical protein